MDDNHVILEDVDKVAGEDYINASFINGYYNRVEFIATQHPVATTKGDLWRMIVERDVNTLVVIGALKDESVSSVLDYLFCVCIPVHELCVFLRTGVCVYAYMH